MKIGLYFGSFNPIHVGHLIIASYIANNCDIDKVWFVVSPQNPHKPSHSLLNEYQRLHLVNIAIDGDVRFKASNIEFGIPKPSYTIDTLTYLQEKYPSYEFEIIIGSDSINNLHKWKNYELLIKNYSFLVYERPNFPVKISNQIKVKVLKAPLLDISSTQIRSYIKDSKSISYLVTKAVEDDILANGYYK
jgi:nicotinate-nucleotide adenylyltransferase